VNGRSVYKIKCNDSSSFSRATAAAGATVPMGYW
jgi:hypothetical protein